MRRTASASLTSSCHPGSWCWKSPGVKVTRPRCLCRRVNGERAGAGSARRPPRRASTPSGQRTTHARTTTSSALLLPPGRSRLRSRGCAAPAASSRQRRRASFLRSRAHVVPVHRMQRLRPSGTSAGRLVRQPARSVSERPHPFGERERGVPQGDPPAVRKWPVRTGTAQVRNLIIARERLGVGRGQALVAAGRRRRQGCPGVGCAARP